MSSLLSLNDDARSYTNSSIGTSIAGGSVAGGSEDGSNCSGTAAAAAGGAEEVGNVEETVTSSCGYFYICAAHNIEIGALETKRDPVLVPIS